MEWLGEREPAVAKLRARLSSPHKETRAPVLLAASCDTATRITPATNGSPQHRAVAPSGPLSTEPGVYGLLSTTRGESSFGANREVGELLRFLPFKVSWKESTTSSRETNALPWPSTALHASVHNEEASPGLLSAKMLAAAFMPFKSDRSVQTNSCPNTMSDLLQPDSKREMGNSLLPELAPCRSSASR